MDYCETIRHNCWPRKFNWWKFAERNHSACTNRSFLMKAFSAIGNYNKSNQNEFALQAPTSILKTNFHFILHSSHSTMYIDLLCTAAFSFPILPRSIDLKCDIISGFAVNHFSRDSNSKDFNERTDVNPELLFCGSSSTLSWDLMLSINAINTIEVGQ